MLRCYVRDESLDQGLHLDVDDERITKDEMLFHTRSPVCYYGHGQRSYEVTANNSHSSELLLSTSVTP